MAESPETSAPEALHCYRHPNRETLLSCSNCERPICTSCLTQAAVGVRCPECARGTTASGPAGAVGERAKRALGTRGGTVAAGVLVALNLLVFLAEMAQGVGVSGVSGSSIVSDGGLFGPAVADGEWYRMVSAAFLHASLIHVGFNAYLLWLLGSSLERYAGPGRFLAIYFIAVLWGSAGALLFAPDSITVGASGGVFGLMAAVYLLERQRGVALLGGSVGGLLLLNLVITFVLPGISIGGHLGGIVGGALAGFVLSGFGRGHMAYGRLNAPVAASLAALAVAAVVIGVSVV
jgi:membrane associated rhomboid family serine protease